jgi:hypothetical protein
MKVLFYVLAFTVFGAFMAQAGEMQVQGKAQSAAMSKVASLSIGIITEPKSLVTPIAHRRRSHWHFAGCVRSHNQCHHRARDRGYHHASVRRNHSRCHHEPHLACYIRN